MFTVVMLASGWPRFRPSDTAFKNTSGRITAIAISTSGNSPNVLKGIEAAKSLGMTTIAWTGGSGGKLAGLADYAFVVPSTVTARIQESHITLAHVLCELIEDQVLANQA